MYTNAKFLVVIILQLMDLKILFIKMSNKKKIKKKRCYISLFFNFIFINKEEKEGNLIQN